MLTQPYNAATLNVLYCFIFLHKRILRQGKRLTVFAMMCTNTPCKHLQTHTHTHQHRLHACTDKQPYKLQEAHTKRERCMSGILSQNCRSDMVKYTQEFNLTEKHLKQQACQLTDDWQASPPMLSSSLIHVPAAWSCLTALLHPAQWPSFFVAEVETVALWISLDFCLDLEWWGRFSELH